jgi:hypothetical protein
MGTRTQVALAIGVGYLLGRQKRMRTALVLGAAAAAGRLSRDPRGLLQHGVGALRSAPELSRVTDLGKPLADAGKAVAAAAVNRGIDSVGGSIRRRADSLRGQGSREETQEDSREDRGGRDAREGRRGRADDRDERASDRDDDDRYDDEADDDEAADDEAADDEAGGGAARDEAGDDEYDDEARDDEYDDAGSDDGAPPPVRARSGGSGRPARGGDDFPLRRGGRPERSAAGGAPVRRRSR